MRGSSARNQINSSTHRRKGAKTRKESKRTDPCQSRSYRFARSRRCRPRACHSREGGNLVSFVVLAAFRAKRQEKRWIRATAGMTVSLGRGAPTARPQKLTRPASQSRSWLHQPHSRSLRETDRPHKSARAPTVAWLRRLIYRRAATLSRVSFARLIVQFRVREVVAIQSQCLLQPRHAFTR